MKKYILLSLVILASIYSFGQSTVVKSEFTVYGNCEMCKSRIEAAVKGLEGIKSVHWNVNSKIIKVKFDSNKVSLDQIHKAIAAIGYRTEKLYADSAGYKKLPDCCQVANACKAKE